MQNNIVTIADALPPHSSDTSAEASLYFIVGCGDNDIATSGVTKLVDDTVVSFEQAQTDLDSVTATPATQQYVDNLQALFVAAEETLTGTDGVTTQVSCAKTNGLYGQARDNLCDDMLNPLIQLFGLQLVASVLLFFAILVAMPFWNAQPKPAEANMRPVMSPQVGSGAAVPY